MASASSGRYQSRLFNFIHQQSRYWGGQVESTFRHLQVAAHWSLEILLYPIYLFIQKATESVGKQLPGGEQQYRRELKGNDENSPLQTPPPEVSEKAPESLQAETLKQKYLLTEIDRLLTKLTGGQTENKLSLPSTMGSNLSVTNRVLGVLDTTVAQLEIHALVPISHASGQVLQTIQTLVHDFIYGKPHLTQEKYATAHRVTNESWTLKIQALIWDALNYFFGAPKGHKLTQNTSTSQKLPVPPPQPQLVFPNGENIQEDLWLRPSDLFISSQAISQLSTSTQTPSGKVSVTKPTSEIISQWRKKDQQKTITHQQSWQTTDVEAKPDWIETKAQTIGYEKHPLEQLLEWLDRVILLLERILVSIFQLLQRLWQGK